MRCDHYEPVKENLLIIKLGAMGDVLRTTTILPALKKKYPLSRITWVTQEESYELLQPNPYLDNILIAEKADTLPQLLAQEYEVAINLDLDHHSSALLKLCSARNKLGYCLDQRGGIRPASMEAEEWFLMSIDDQIKKANKKTYQEHIFQICQLPYNQERPLLPLTDSVRNFISEIRQQYSLSEQDRVVAIHSGAGNRWENKKWTIEGYISLIERLVKNDAQLKVLLLGSNIEQERNKQIQKQFLERVYCINTHNSLSGLIGLISISRVLVSGDTLPLHIATALRVPVVAIFGPTSAQEIELYGLGHKIVPQIDCLCCYQPTCEYVPNCMQLVDPEQVYQWVWYFLR
jgi:heptosyltransferase-2